MKNKQNGSNPKLSHGLVLNPIRRNLVKKYGLNSFKGYQSKPDDKVLKTYHSAEVFEFTFN